MQGIKIKINNGNGDVEECRKVQEILFNAGYTWRAGKYPQFLAAGFLYGNPDGYLSWGRVGSSGNRWFEDSESYLGYVEVRMVEQITHVLEEVPVKRETITIGDSVYDKKQFEEAVKHLKKIH